MSDNKISNQWSDLYMQEGVLIAAYKTKVCVDLEAAKIIHIQREVVCEGKKVPAIADTRGGLYWTKESRKYMSGEENNRLITSVAIVINSSVVKTIVNYYLNFDKPVVPTKLFTSMVDAIEWSKTFRIMNE